MGAWTKIKDYTVPSNTTSVVLDNFGTITKDDFIKINITTPSNASGFLSLLGNSSSSSDYYTQEIFANGNSVSAARTNANQLNSSSGSSNIFVLAKLSEDNKLNIFSNQVVDTSTVYAGFKYITSSGATFPSGINSLTFTSTTIGANSRIQIYKLTAQKVKDITVASNTTQVDLTDLNITPDSEYLLVSDVTQGASTTQYRMFINDNTTLTNYWSQRIRGIGSTTNASRANLPLVTSITSNRTIVHSHIKLSNIGAYTSQHYAIVDAGTSSVYLENYFHSGTAENVTSITKLNLVSEDANSIGAGSRFILYKLY